MFGNPKGQLALKLAFFVACLKFARCKRLNSIWRRKIKARWNPTVLMHFFVIGFTFLQGKTILTRDVA